MSRLPLHPRLARIMIEAGGAHEAAIACAMLSDRQLLPRHPPTTTCDLLAGLDASLPPHIARNARELERGFAAAVQHGATVQHGPTLATACRAEALAKAGSTPATACRAEALAKAGSTLEVRLRRALLAGYPDRVAQRRAPGDPRVLLASGHGGVIGPESGVREGDYVVALDVQAGRRGEQSEARIRIASIVEKDWLKATSVERVHELDAASGVVRAREREMYGALVLKERDVVADAATVAQQLAEAYLRRGLPDPDRQLVARLRFAGIELDLPEVALRAASGRRKLDAVHLADGLDWNVKQQLDERAPATFTAPSGRTHPLEYREDGSVALSIKLQELFGLAATPQIGFRREPLLILLLAPNGRPVQTTRDLRSFWDTTYPEVRKELRGRYPKHPWPEDPWRAAPTARTTRGARRP